MARPSPSPAPSEDAGERSPLVPFLGGVALALAVATLIVRTLTTGAGIELHQPGTQVLFDALAFTAAFSLVVGRALAGQAVWWSDPGRLLAAGVFVAVLVVAAARAPHADLAWRTALTWSALLALGLSVGDLARDGRVARWLVGGVVACVVVGAGLALQQGHELSQLRERAAGGGLESLELFPADFRKGLYARLMGGGVSGPYVLPNLLACAVAMVLPLTGVVAWSLRRSWRGLVPAAGALVLLAALLLSGSKGGVLAAAGAGAAFAVLHPRLRPWRGRLVLAGGAVGLLLGAGGLVAFALDPETHGVGLSVTVRLEYWEAGLAMWRDAPWLGKGLNQFREFFGAYKSVRAEEALHAHNAFVQLLAETGVVGLAAALGLVVAWVRPGRRALRALVAGGGSAPGGADAGGALVGGGAGRDPSGADAGARAGGGKGSGAGTGGAGAPAPLLSERGVVVALGIGHLAAFLLLAGFGDFVSARSDTRGAFLAAFLALPVAAWGCRPEGRAGASLVPAALAGAVAFGVDALTDFGLHHAGVLALFVCLLGLCPALGPALPPGRGQPRALRVVLAALTGALAFGLTFGVTSPALEADLAREAGRRRHLRAASLLREAEEAERRGAPADARQATERAREQLVAAAEELATASDGYPWHGDTERRRAAVLRALGRRDEAVAALERAVELDPRSPAAWEELGLLLVEREPKRALACLDRAVALHPHHPGRLLDAARARVELLRARPPARRPAELGREARELLERAAAASAGTRLVRRRLTSAEEDELERLTRALDSLDDVEAPPAPERRAGPPPGGE